ncbi:sigma-70 family RNA polymerase sigma factor [Dactylosporangium sp. CS-047395]|uniref:sigma-70 family RNA polymerase sigma factor n=1 Tax=Dactylosporangium sp. CS-047395 TaxID=3239936 RepID=UPI003D9273FC
MAQEEARTAVAEAYRAHYRRLVAAVYAATGDFAGAQDAVQEAYAAAMDRPARFAALEDPQAWLRVVALNAARQRWRRRQVFDRLVRLGRVPKDPEPAPPLTGDRIDLMRALQSLPRPTREAIVLHHLFDLTVEQVADELGAPVGTIKARLTRGRARLADVLQPDPAHR